MDSFGNLSIGDNFTSGMEHGDEELVGLSNLSISKNGPTLSPQLINRFMPHFPSSPSPLRNALDFSVSKGDEEENDLMEIDEVDDTSFGEVYDREPTEAIIEVDERSIVEEIEVTPEDKQKQENSESQNQHQEGERNIVSPHHGNCHKGTIVTDRFRRSGGY